MINPKDIVYYYPNNLFRILLMSIEEIIGHNGLNAVLNQAVLPHLKSHYPPNDFKKSISFDDISRIQLSLEQLYGPRGGRGLALRAGRVFFQTGVREFADELGITDTNFRLLPLDKKIIAGLEAWARLINEYSDQQIEVKDFSEEILWTDEHCPYCWNRTVDTQVCFLEVGMLQEAFYWISGGKIYSVNEIKCCAMGDSPCTVSVIKASLD